MLPFAYCLVLLVIIVMYVAAQSCMVHVKIINIPPTICFV